MRRAITWPQVDPDVSAIAPGSPYRPTSSGIESRILLVRGQEVLIGADLAELYGVPTKRLNEQVKRNGERFPEDFCFQLSPAEREEVVASCDHLARLKFSPVLPYAFTGLLRSGPRRS